jgi:hypothetical protein
VGFPAPACTEPKLKSVGLSKNNTDEHRPKFSSVIHRQPTIPPDLCQGASGNIFGNQTQILLIPSGSYKNQSVGKPRWQIRTPFQIVHRNFPRPTLSAEKLHNFQIPVYRLRLIVSIAIRNRA